MDLRSLLQDILSEVSSKIINFQMKLHLLITLVRSSDCFRFIESLISRLCSFEDMRHGITINREFQKRKIPYMQFGFEKF